MKGLWAAFKVWCQTCEDLESWKKYDLKRIANMTWSAASTRSKKDKRRRRNRNKPLPSLHVTDLIERLQRFYIEAEFAQQRCSKISARMFYFLKRILSIHFLWSFTLTETSQEKSHRIFRSNHTCPSFKHWKKTEDLEKLGQTFTSEIESFTFWLLVSLFLLFCGRKN